MNKWVTYMHWVLSLRKAWTALVRNTAWKVSKYGVISGPYFPVFGLNTEIYGVKFTPWNLSKLENVLSPFEQNCSKVHTKHFSKLSKYSIITDFFQRKEWVLDFYVMFINSCILSFNTFSRVLFLNDCVQRRCLRIMPKP